MRNILSTITAGAAAGVMAVTMSTGLHISQAQATELPNLMIMGEDADYDTVPRSSRVFTRVLNQLSEELNNDGFDVYDETTVSLDNFAQGRSRRSDAELIDIARSVNRPPIDIAIMFQIYASAERLDYTTKVRTRVVGRLLDVHSGRRMGNFEINSPRNFRAPADCNRECILETVGNNASLLAREVGEVLVAKLADEVDYGTSAANQYYDDDRGTEYTRNVSGNDGCRGRARDMFLVFDNFTEQEMLDMEDVILAKFSCYVSHRPAGNIGRQYEYTYKTRLDSGKLRRNLVRAMEYLGMPGKVQFQGNEYKITKVVQRRKDRYSSDGSKW